MCYTCCGIVLQHTWLLCCGAQYCMLHYTAHSYCNPYIGYQQLGPYCYACGGHNSVHRHFASGSITSHPAPLPCCLVEDDSPKPSCNMHLSSLQPKHLVKIIIIIISFVFNIILILVIRAIYILLLLLLLCIL